MSEERPQHTQEPAEGSDEDVGAAGAERAEGVQGQVQNTDEEATRPAHTPEPAEGDDEDVEAPGAERAGDGA
jgi:hypothetical protein